MAKVELRPNFDSSNPLEALGLTVREAEVRLWVAQGKSNADIATILGCAENTVKVHLSRALRSAGSRIGTPPPCERWRCSVRLVSIDEWTLALCRD